MEDIRTKAHLSSTQKIGLKHYDDFLDRMPREEAAAIEKVVIHLLMQYLKKKTKQKKLLITKLKGMLQSDIPDLHE